MHLKWFFMSFPIVKLKRNKKSNEMNEEKKIPIPIDTGNGNAL